MKLSERIERTRSDRPDEWSMDAMMHEAKKLESIIKDLEKQRINHVRCLATIQDQCIGVISMGFELDANYIGNLISQSTGMDAIRLHEYANKLTQINKQTLKTI